MTSSGWIFWKVTHEGSGALSWLGITRPGARSALGREKMWTLIPRSRAFIANWFITEDFLRSPGGQFCFENIDIAEARGILPDLPDPSPEDVTRIARPERMLSIDQVDRFEVLKVMGNGAAVVLRQRRS